MQYSLSIKRKGEEADERQQGAGVAQRQEGKERTNTVKPEEKWVIDKLLVLLGAFGGSAAKNHLPRQQRRVPSLGWEDPLEKGMATHCSISAWGTPGTAEPGGYSPGGRRESDSLWFITTFQ